MASLDQDPLMGILERSPLSQLFFNPKNIETIQSELRFRVYQKTKIVVDKQSQKELLIVMRSIFLQNSVNQSSNLTEQVQTLNENVLGYCVKNVASNALQQRQFLADASSMPIPMQHPVGTANRNRLTFSLHPEETSVNRTYSPYPYSTTLR
jgi:hypothetical protein